MPRGLKRYYGGGDLHFLTFSCHRRMPLLGPARRRDLFLRALEQVRADYRFAIVGYVVMPEHVHLLVTKPQVKDVSFVIKALKQSVARRVFSSSRKRKGYPTRGCPTQAVLACVGNEDRPRRFWQPRFYDFNVWSAKKRIEKLRYMHRNPVKRRLVEKPEDWRWSSYRAYAYGEKGLVTLNAVFPPKWALSQAAER